MNVFKNINTEYLRSSRTIETIEVFDSKIKKKFYVYNYEGYSFRVFDDVNDLNSFLEVNSSKYLHFNTNYELDNYLSKVVLD